MRMRKLFAGLAAAATMLGGLALGATATADTTQTELNGTAGNQNVTLIQDAPTNITITGAKARLAGHKFKYVRIGTYTYAKTAPYAETDGDTLKVAGVSVETDSAAKDYLNTVLTQVDDAYAKDTVYYSSNPAGYIAEHMNDSGASASPTWSGTLRNFVTKLAQNDAFQKSSGTSAEVNTNIGENADGVSSFAQSVSQGLYVVVDVTNNASPSDDVKGTEGKYRASIPMVVGTKIVGTVAYTANDGSPTSTTREFDLASGPLGTVSVKNDRPTIDKTITGVDDTTTDKENQQTNVTADGKAASAAVGDKISYKIGNVEIPSTVGYDTIKFQYTFKITDTLHKGQTYNDDAKVYVDKNGDGKLTDDELLRAASSADADKSTYDYVLTVTKPTANDADQNTTILVDLAKYVGGYSNDRTALVDGSAAGLDPDLIGKKIYVTYTATLNDDAIVYPDGSNDNGVKLDYSNNPGSESHGTVTPPDTQVFTGKFGLKKVNKDGKTLAGAKFTVSKNGQAIAFTGTAGSYKVATADAKPTATEVEVGADGLLHLSGLEGTYTVKETQAPAGYSSLFLPEFQVTVTTTPIKSDTLVNNKWYMSSDMEMQDGKPVPVDKANAKTTVTVAKQDVWKLVDNGVIEGNVKVTNVTSVSQLPLTGAAGIMLFTMAGLLLAAAAGLVYTKSRATTRALRRH
ncbi:peptidase [Bifidobacterium ramosum]|uniref:Isopeptide-forming domain-containing fimbrial protein n=2 Tax=Bifidobacterium ramosum TaxID=1798158 RepID=A0A6L4WY09_9BIFI|nr:SpaA isopeptide-forming pilin-related protein [Bifidobacterium ramosum]KAB8287120.1 peptidase [Bifidobacterium ramosum]NEG72725.1 isopeptide-forming domain-containing fimbrial protein [Bifidobacterium ramosum]NEG72726.1 isopeptide-forming domain-containing fimbrial protein [Bifidobacterium ramosum]